MTDILSPSSIHASVDNPLGLAAFSMTGVVTGFGYDLVLKGVPGTPGLAIRGLKLANDVVIGYGIGVSVEGAPQDWGKLVAATGATALGV